MTLPWEAAPPPVSTAEAMQPDTPIPAAVPPPSLPVVATNRATGQRIGVELAPQLQVALQGALDEMVAHHPVVARLARSRPSRGQYDRVLMESSVLDMLVVIAAVLVTVVSPTSSLVGLLWVAAGVLALRTLIQGGFQWVTNRTEAAP